MIRFREKSFAAKVNGEVLRKGSPIIGVTGLGLSGYNLAVNQKRAKKDREFYESQEKATRELANAIKQLGDEEELYHAANKYKASKKKPYKQVIVSDIVPVEKDRLTKFKKKKKK